MMNTLPATACGATMLERLILPSKMLSTRRILRKEQAMINPRISKRLQHLFSLSEESLPKQFENPIFLLTFINNLKL
jgi:hypothetical protein